MKKYTTPDMKVMAFMAEEEISATANRNEGSNIFNDAEFGSW